MTVLYDDIDAEKVKKAKDMFDLSEIPDFMQVDEVELWDVSFEEQRREKVFNLGGK